MTGYGKKSFPFVPTRGSRVVGQHKDKKERITEALRDLQLMMAGLGSLGEGAQDMARMAEVTASLARACSVFLRKLVLGHARKREARLLDDEVLDSLNMRLQPLRRIPRDVRRPVETGFGVDRVGMALTRIDEETGQPAERYEAVGGTQGLSIVVEWPLPGMADWVEAPSESQRWLISADQLINTGSDRAMTCGDWLGQQVVMFDSKGISLEKMIRTVANLEGAHAESVGRLAVVQGETPSNASRDPEIHILRNITLFGVGYVELVVIEAALYLYWRLLDEPSIRRPGGSIVLATPAFECSPEQVGSSRPGWLGFRGGTMASFSPRPGIVRHDVRGVGGAK